MATLSAKLCDVFPDGQSSLLTRGLLNLTHRSTSTAPEPVPPGEWVDADVELEAMTWDAAPGHRPRLSVAAVTWRVERDVLGRTSCVDEHGSDSVVDGGRVRGRYSGRVEVATGTFAQRAEASADFTVSWPEAAVRARADLVVEAGPTSYDIDLTLETWQDGEPFGPRRWTRSIPRAFG